MGWIVFLMLSCCLASTANASVSPQKGSCLTETVEIFPPDIMNTQWYACYHTDCINPSGMTTQIMKEASRRSLENEIREELVQKYCDKDEDVEKNTTKDTGDVRVNPDTKAFELCLDNQKIFPDNHKFLTFEKNHKVITAYSCLEMQEDMCQVCAWVFSRGCGKVPQVFMDQQLDLLKEKLKLRDENFMKTDWDYCQ